MCVSAVVFALHMNAQGLRNGLVGGHRTGIRLGVGFNAWHGKEHCGGIDSHDLLHD
jgi:hypothetical protein